MRIIRNEELLYAQKKIDLEISEISYGFLDSSWNLQNLRAAFTRVYLPLRGKGFVTIRDRRIELLPDRIYIIPAGLNFSCECPEMLEKIYIHLNLTHPDGSDVFSGISSCLVLPNEQERIERLRSLYDQKDVPSVLRFKLLLYEILLDALSLQDSEHTEISEYSKITKDALTYIDAHLRSSLTIGEIASHLFVSKLLVQQHFKNDLQKPIGQYIDERLMAKAERELLDESRSIKEISDRLGYCDQFYFSRRFTQMHDGTGPMLFRQMHRVIPKPKNIEK